MNQEQLLDDVANKLTLSAGTGVGTLLLFFENDFFVVKLDKSVPKDSILIGKFDCETIKTGLAPSDWLKLSRQLWAAFCLSSKSAQRPTKKLFGDKKDDPSRSPPAPKVS